MNRTSRSVRGHQQQRVHERKVIADEQRAAFGGDVLPALHPDAIDGAGEPPTSTKRSSESGSSHNT